MTHTYTLPPEGLNKKLDISLTLIGAVTIKHQETPHSGWSKRLFWDARGICAELVFRFEPHAGARSWKFGFWENLVWRIEISHWIFRASVRGWEFPLQVFPFAYISSCQNFSCVFVFFADLGKSWQKIHFFPHVSSIKNISARKEASRNSTSYLESLNRNIPNSKFLLARTCTLLRNVILNFLKIFVKKGSLDHPQCGESLGVWR